MCFFSQLLQCQKAGLEWHEDLENVCQQAGLRGKKLSKVSLKVKSCVLLVVVVLLLCRVHSALGYSQVKDPFGDNNDKHGDDINGYDNVEHSDDYGM